MALRTEESLQLLFQQTKQIQKRKVEKQKQKYKKATEQVKKELEKKNKQKQNINKPIVTVKYTNVAIYHSNLIERETAENDLYQTRQELMQAENRNEGKINWILWDKLVNKLRK